MTPTPWHHTAGTWTHTSGYTVREAGPGVWYIHDPDGRRLPHRWYTTGLGARGAVEAIVATGGAR